MVLHRWVVTFPLKSLAKTYLFSISIIHAVETRWKDDVDPSSTVIFPFSFCISGVGFSRKILICCVVSLRCSSSRINLKSLINFSLMLDQLSVLPHASLILYHLFDIPSSLFGNMCGHTHSSLYPIMCHSFSQWWMCSTRSYPTLKRDEGCFE